MAMKTSVDYAQERLLRILREVLHSRFIFQEKGYLNPENAIASDRITFDLKTFQEMGDDNLKDVIKDHFGRVLFIALETKGLHCLADYQFVFCSKVTDYTNYDYDGNFTFSSEIYIHCK